MEENNYYDQLILCDKAFRAAISGSEEELKKYVGEISEKLKDNINSLPPFMNTSIFCSYYAPVLRLIHIILAVRGDARKLDYISDCLDDQNSFATASVSLRTEMLLISCVKGDDEMISRALDIEGFNSSSLSTMIFENPLYILFIFGKNEIGGKFVEKCLDELYISENRATNLYSVGNIGFFNEMIAFGNVSYSDELAEFLFGQLTRIPIYFLQNIAFCPKMLDYIIRNKYKCFGFEDRTEPPGLDEFLRNKNPYYGEELVIIVLYEIFKSSDKKTFRRYLEACSPVSDIKLQSLKNTDVYEIVNNLPEKTLDKLIAPEVRVRMLQNSDFNLIDKAEWLLKGHKMCYDLSEYVCQKDKSSEDEEELSFFLGQHIMGSSEAAKFLKKVINVPHIPSLCDFIRNCLDLNSKLITRQLISKGFVNSDNFAEAVEYASEKKLYKALCELSHMT
ncbi:MAG: hypothetical protein MSJ26_00525 [Oscillospiraceae bacterium]|nr:hypothetical protein [Oscillospiraceae bacterium]